MYMRHMYNIKYPFISWTRAVASLNTIITDNDTFKVNNRTVTKTITKLSHPTVHQPLLRFDNIVLRLSSTKGEL